MMKNIVLLIPIAQFVVIDNCANSHIWNDWDHFVNFCNLVSNVSSVATIGGRNYYLVGIGSVDVQIPSDASVLHSNGIKRNLYGNYNILVVDCQK